LPRVQNANRRPLFAPALFADLAVAVDFVGLTEGASGLPVYAWVPPGAREDDECDVEGGGRLRVLGLPVPQYPGLRDCALLENDDPVGERLGMVGRNSEEVLRRERYDGLPGGSSCPGDSDDAGGVKSFRLRFLPKKPRPPPPFFLPSFPSFCLALALLSGDSPAYAKPRPFGLDGPAALKETYSAVGEDAWELGAYEELPALEPLALA
jgi:hypothetical protein